MIRYTVGRLRRLDLGMWLLYGWWTGGHGGARAGSYRGTVN
eukprot:CAMPEP_0202898150 /NCGR_PEP_ID=MMETSP1392-20130828/6752_1 /ASSEMBLY_ACC=CAM_ASM_000868 /TAXON_ID=225041 /ORGANISM="Chlamydomonas chlamydogama, Strain SAG 11-48b" /LENGTH=40 /DNA_ID= /DNA_START= /DNA_END= /DNA_ORIENTATION=